MNVSVLIATYGDDYWYELADERAVASAREQTDNVQHLHVRHGMTLAQARNALARIAPGDWLCFLDGDDELEPGYLAAMATAWENVRHTWGGTPPLLVPLLRRTTAAWASYPNKGRWPELNECVIGTLVHRALFEQVGGFREWPLYEDWDLFLRCHDAGAKLLYTDAVYREHVNPQGRNYSPNPRAVYDEIWAEHLARVSAA